MTWIQTFTGRKFFPLAPDGAEVCIEDIAHALSMKCRFNGHCLRFYSVAEHSVRVANRVRALGGDNQTCRPAFPHDRAFSPALRVNARREDSRRCGVDRTRAGDWIKAQPGHRRIYSNTWRIG